MSKIIALIGRANVGKSSLFNRLTNSRDALVFDKPGVTRDRLYGTIQLPPHEWLLVDLPGYVTEKNLLFADWMNKQLEWALDQADILLWLVEAEAATSEDLSLQQRLRSINIPIYLILNKSDLLTSAKKTADPIFWTFPHTTMLSISAKHGSGIDELLDNLAEQQPSAAIDNFEQTQAKQTIKITVVGRPNVGKSTLINAWLQEKRVLVADMPGTTLDTIQIPFVRNQQDYLLIDTAGVRKKSRIHESLEQFSISKSLAAITSSHVVVLIIDGEQGFVDQDLQLANYIIDSGRCLVLVVNKADLLDQHAKKQLISAWETHAFLHFAPLHWIAACRRQGIQKIWQSINTSFASAIARYPTSQLTMILEQALTQHQPPLHDGRRIKLRYAHLGQKFPLSIIIHGKQTARVPKSYQQYLRKFFQKRLSLTGVPLRLVFRTDNNPFGSK